jgi:hypothetical protein
VRLQPRHHHRRSCGDGAAKPNKEHSVMRPSASSGQAPRRPGGACATPAHHLPWPGAWSNAPDWGFEDGEMLLPSWRWCLPSTAA